jgi:hypothetical protein
MEKVCGSGMSGSKRCSFPRMAVLSLVIDIAESLSSWILKARELLILAVLKPIHHKPMGFNSLLHSTELTIIWKKFLFVGVVIFVVFRTSWLFL